MFTVFAAAGRQFRRRVDIRPFVAIAVAIHLALFLFSPDFWPSPGPQKAAATPPIEVVNAPEYHYPPLESPPERPSEDPRALEPVDEPVPSPRPPAPPLPESPGVVRAPAGPGAFTALLTRMPEPVATTAPVYPRLAREAGIEGTVRVRALVSADGEVLEAIVVESDVTAAMQRSALEAARKWRFRPARQGSRAVPAWVEIPFRFRLGSDGF